MCGVEAQSECSKIPCVWKTHTVEGDPETTGWDGMMTSEVEGCLPAVCTPFEFLRFLQDRALVAPASPHLDQ